MKNTFINLSIIAVAILLSILTYSNLSPEIAIHWTNGQVNRTVAKLLGALLIPAVMFVAYGIFYLLLKTDPKKENLNNRIKNISISTVLLLFPIHVAVQQLDYDLDMNIMAGLIIGTVVMILGNIMPQHNSIFKISLILLVAIIGTFHS